MRDSDDHRQLHNYETNDKCPIKIYLLHMYSVISSTGHVHKYIHLRHLSNGCRTHPRKEDFSAASSLV